MDPEYNGEELGNAVAWDPFGAVVKYLSPSERSKYEVVVDNGVLFDQSGIPLDGALSSNGKLMFVMDTQGKIYMGEHRVMEFHHSSFLGGNRFP